MNEALDSIGRLRGGAGRGAAGRQALALSALALAAGLACAQTVPPAPTSASPPAGAAAAPDKDNKAEGGSSLETITISATRRRELIREVPLAISSIAAERLAETGARTLNDFLATQPGVVLQNSGVADNAGSIVIRGLTAGIDSNSPTTVYVDDTALSSGTTFDVDLLDLRRFEVLRGPQGTLYGASAMGGVIKYVTHDPDSGELSGRVGLTVSSTRSGGINTAVRGVINVPLKQDVAALRVALFGSRDAGYVDATGPLAQENVNEKQSRGARVSLLVTPTRRLSLKLTAMTQTRESDGNDRISYDLATRKPAAGDLVFTGLTYAEPRKATRDIGSFTVEYDFSGARFASITSTQKARDDLTTDFSGFAVAFGLTSAYVENRLRDKRTTQEFRLVSQTAGRFEWLAGAYFSKAEGSSKGLTMAFAGTAGFPLQDDLSTRDFEEHALYGNVTWNATPELALTAGARAARYEQTDVVRQLNAATKSIVFEEQPKTYLLTAKLRLSPRSNVYARVASGYRPGGANFDAVDQNNVPVPGAPPSYGTDKAVTYEAGWKSSLAGGAGSFEIAAFHTDWRDLQQVTRSLLGGFTSNLGKARIRGIEMAGSLQPVRDLTLGAALSLMDPVLLSDSPGLGGKAGDRLPSSPKVAASISSRYAFDLGGRSSFAGLNVQYMGNRYSSFEGSPISPNFVMPSYVQVDLSGGITLGRFELGLFVRNLTDARGIIGAATSETLAVGRTYAKVITPRTIGLNLSASF